MGKVHKHAVNNFIAINSQDGYDFITADDIVHVEDQGMYAGTSVPVAKRRKEYLFMKIRIL
jgi:hypothetical protein